MELHVSLAGRGDLASRIYRQLHDAILDGRLRPGERLPPTRELAARLDVARNTVSVAYERLVAEGFLVARVGAGTFVHDAPVASTRPRAAPVGSVRPRPVWSSVTLSSTGGPRPAYDFRLGTPDADLFPLATWRRLVAGELRASAIKAAGYGDPAGHPGLREAIARYVGVSRSVRASTEDVLVTQGAQQAIDLVSRVLIEPGDRVAVEEPGYPPARQLFHSQGARVAGVPVDDEGLVVEAIPADARLIYVTPSHQFPLGIPMSLARRAALLDWAAGHGAVIVEDDYDSEFRFTDRPLEPLQSLDRTGHVIYVGTFSKTLLPMLRLGFLVAPASIHAALRAAQQLTIWHAEYATQAALARFIDSGELPRHIRRATRVYAARHALISAALSEIPYLDPIPSAAGLHLCARLNAPIDLGAALTRAREHGVAVESLASYGFGERRQVGLALGYGAIPTDRVATGLALLAEAMI